MDIRRREELISLHTDWVNVILDYKDIGKIFNFMDEERDRLNNICEVFPTRKDIFRCFKYFNVRDTKVVILGQDPYHSKNQATGVCFAVPPEQKLPPSLRNIQAELVNDIGIDMKSKNLEYWAAQGVLLLNSALTVIQNKPASHMKMWLPFTKYIIDYIDANCDNVVFVAWGAFAYNKLMNVDRKKHTLIVSSHPSPLSANKKLKNFPPFKGSKPFSKINKKHVINW